MVMESNFFLSRVYWYVLLEVIDDGFCIIEFIDGLYGLFSDYVYIEVNLGYYWYIGIEGIVGKCLCEIELDNVQVWLDVYGQVLLIGQLLCFEQEFQVVGWYIEVLVMCVGLVEMCQVLVLFCDIIVCCCIEVVLCENVQCV